MVGAELIKNRDIGEQILRLKRDGMTDKEVAEKLGTTHKAIKMRIMRLRASGIEIPNRKIFKIRLLKQLVTEGLCLKDAAAQIGMSHWRAIEINKDVPLADKKTIKANAVNAMIAKKRIRGLYYQQSTIDEVYRLRDKGNSEYRIGKELGIPRTSVQSMLLRRPK